MEESCDFHGIGSNVHCWLLVEIVCRHQVREYHSRVWPMVSHSFTSFCTRWRFHVCGRSAFTILFCLFLSVGSTTGPLRTWYSMDSTTSWIGSTSVPGTHSVVLSAAPCTPVWWSRLVASTTCFLSWTSMYTSETSACFSLLYSGRFERVNSIFMCTLS